MTNDEVRVAEGALSEQCESCGADIAETGDLRAGATIVKCSEHKGGCGFPYAIYVKGI